MRRIYLSFILLFGFGFLSAQVPVSKEPRHHLVFANEKVRILNVLLPPGDTTFFHLHSTPSVFINLSQTKTGSQLIHQQPTYSSSFSGNIYFENLSAPHTRIHRVWNDDTSIFHVVDVELLSKDSGFTQKPLQITHVQLLTDTPWVRTYKIELNKNETVTLREKQRSFILITLKQTTVEIEKNGKQVKEGSGEGDFIWLNTGDTISIANQQNTKASFALLEIK